MLQSIAIPWTPADPPQLYKSNLAKSHDELLSLSTKENQDEVLHRPPSASAGSTQPNSQGLFVCLFVCLFVLVDAILLRMDLQKRTICKNILCLYVCLTHHI